MKRRSKTRRCVIRELPITIDIFYPLVYNTNHLPYLAFDVGYAHLFIPDPQVNFSDGQGHILRGKYDTSIDILSASVTLLWGGPREAAAPETPGKQPISYRK